MAMSLERRRRIQPHERTIARLKQELGVNERREQRVAVGGVEPPQPARLRGGEAQPRHLEKFPLHSSVEIDANQLTKKCTTAHAKMSTRWFLGSPANNLLMQKLISCQHD
jgi:CO/xanthine dehydrogenase FAD-binding subunit